MNGRRNPQRIVRTSEYTKHKTHTQNVYELSVILIQWHLYLCVTHAMCRIIYWIEFMSVLMICFDIWDVSVTLVY